jgi:hypothetical protein
MPHRKPDGEKITVIVSDHLDGRYGVMAKANMAPSNTYKGKSIKWVASFGFKPKAGIAIAQNRLDKHGFMKGELDESYDIELVKEGEVLVYYDGSTLKEVAYRPQNAKMGDLVQATFKESDPPVGWVK